VYKPSVRNLRGWNGLRKLSVVGDNDKMDLR